MHTLLNKCFLDLMKLFIISLVEKSLDKILHTYRLFLSVSSSSFVDILIYFPMPSLWCVSTLFIRDIMIFLFLPFSPSFLLILGSLRAKVRQWLLGCGKKHCDVNCSSRKMMLLESFYDFPERFISRHPLVNASVNYDDGDLDAWGFEAKRWTRVYFLVIKKEQDLVPILKVSSYPLHWSCFFDVIYILLSFLMLYFSIVWTFLFLI